MTVSFSRAPVRARPWIAAVLGLALGGCVRYVEVDRGPQAYYQTAFPSFDTSRQLAEAFGALRRIESTATYDVHIFKPDSAPTEAEIRSGSGLARAVASRSASTTRRSTATQISRGGSGLVLLSTHHGIQFPDTIFEYARDEEERLAGNPATAPGARRVQQVSIKRLQTDWVFQPFDIVPFQVLAEDWEHDLALLGSRAPGDAPEELAVLQLGAGDPDRLSWGSFVYVLGYSGGYPLVTRGMVSNPRQEQGASFPGSAFLTDGLWNEGMSGGLILAVRGEGTALEWVGIVRAAAASVDHRLVPEEGAEGAVNSRDPKIPYDGPLFLERYLRIQYGITFSVSMTDIRAFLDRHRGTLLEQGYALPPFE